MHIRKRIAASLSAALLLATPALAAGADIVVPPSLTLEGAVPFEGTSNRSAVYLPGEESPVTAVVENGRITIEDGQSPAMDKNALRVYQDPNTGLYGFEDWTGALVIPCAYSDYIKGFEPEDTAVPVRDGEGLWGLVDRTGAPVVPCQYNMLNPMVDHPDYFCFWTPKGSAGTWGLIDGRGNVLIEPGVWDSLDGMVTVNGQWYVRVYQGSQSGLLDLNGNIFVPVIYNTIAEYREDMAVASTDGEKLGFLGADGKLAVPCRYDWAGPFVQGRAVVGVLDGAAWRCGYIDKSGEEVIPLTYGDAGNFNEAGVAAVTVTPDEMVLIDRAGRVLTERAHTGVSASIADGLICFSDVQPDGSCLFGYLNQYGKVAIPARFDSAQDFQGGLAAVSQQGKHGIIDVTGAFVLQPDYDALNLYAQNDYVWVQQDGLYGVAKLDYTAAGQPAATAISLNGKEVSLPAYTIQNGSGGMTCVKLRDAAALLSGTDAQCNVTWDAATGNISLTSGQPYVSVGGELAELNGQSAGAQPNRATVLLDGRRVALDAYTFGENNYVQLRELGRLLDFSVDWQDGVVILDTTAPHWAD